MYTLEGVAFDQAPIDSEIATIDSYDRSNKSGQKLLYGYYKISNQRRTARFVYVPEALLSSPSFTFDEVFAAIGINVPNLIFEINGSQEPEDWNIRLPSYKANLATANAGEGALKHFKGVIRENCRRLLKGTAAACEQAGAIFRTNALFIDSEPQNVVAEWVIENPVPLLGLADRELYHPSIVKALIDSARPFGGIGKEDDEEESKKVVKIDIEPWLRGTIKHNRDPQTNRISKSAPMACLTHLILSDDMALLEDKLDKAIPTGMIIIHGGPLTTKDFCDAIQNGQPIFIFKYTGSTADLAVEMLKKVDLFLEKKRSNPSARPEMPFKPNMPDQYRHPRWLDPFGEDYEIKICKMLNILIENFPDRYNPASVLLIDMFNTSEEKLQDQLTKTMSVVFEGIVELGGASAEGRRLTYAWRLRQLLAYNADRQKRISDILEFLVIFFTFASTAVAVLFTFYTTAVVCGESDDYNLKENTCDLSNTTLNILEKLCLALPLFATVFRGISSALNPDAKWSILKIGEIKTEGEIYMYRTKVGKYNPRKQSPTSSAATASNPSQGGNTQHSQSKKDKEDMGASNGSNPRKMFSAALDAVWLDLAASDISKGALAIPPEDSDPLEEINWRIKSNKRHLGMLKSTLSISTMFNLDRPLKSRSKNREDERDPRQRRSTTTDDRDIKVDKFKDFKSVTSNPMFEKGGGARLQEKLIMKHSGSEESLAALEADNRSVTGSQHGSSHYGEDDRHFHDGLGPQGQDNSKDPEEKDLYDDGLSTLTADEYVKIRLQPIITDFTRKTPGLSMFTNTVTIVVIALSVCSSVFSTFGLTAFIPLTLAFAGACTAWRSYKQADLRLMQANGALNQLHQLVIWWDSLSMIEKRVPANKEFLVTTTELTIQTQVVGYLSSKNKDSSDDSEE